MHIDYLSLDGWNDTTYAEWYMSQAEDLALLYSDTHAVFAVESGLITAEAFAGVIF